MSNKRRSAGRRQPSGARRQEQPAGRKQPAASGRRPAAEASSGLQSRELWIGLCILAAVVIITATAGFWVSHVTALDSKPKPHNPVDGISCGTVEQLAYHRHQYIALYYNGKRVTLPSSIGIPNGESNPECYYWIHVHEQYPNIIHVESPVNRTLTLGNFFDIWKSTASSASPSGDTFVKELQTADKHHNVTVFLKGKPWTKDYRSLPLKDYENIWVEIGKPVVHPKLFTSWSKYGL